jgi:DUF4097 and DUF4098 domain-containing protein YvlB
MKIPALILSLICCISLIMAKDQRDIEKHFPTRSSQLVDIRGFYGSEIRVSSWDKYEVSVTLHIEIECSDVEYERNFVNAASIEESRTDSSLVVTFTYPQKDWSERSFWEKFKHLFSRNYIKISISGEIIIPRSNSIRTDINYCSIDLEKVIGEINIFGSFNKLVLKQCPSVHEIKNNYGTISLNQCGGNLAISSAMSSTIFINEFDGGGHIKANYSDITLQKGKEYFTITSQGGKIQVEDARSNLTVKADYCTINIKRIQGMLDIKGTSGGNMTLEDIGGDLNVDNAYTSMDLRNIKGNVNLSTIGSQVNADGIVGNWKSDSKYSAISISKFQGKNMFLKSIGSPIDVELKSIPRHLEIKNEFGPVNATMPTGFAGDVTLESSFDKIECNLPIKIKSLGSGCYAVGKVGSGEGSITIETKSGHLKLLQQ